MALAGVSSLGITFGYGLEATKGVKPGTFTKLTRINQIGGINIEPEQIDASAIEDLVSAYVAGRADNGGSFPVTVNFTPDTNAEWKKLIEDYQGLLDAGDGKQIWFETIIPGFTEAFFCIAQPPQAIPQPEIGQNELLTVEFPLTIVEYKGMEAKVDFQ